MLAPKVVSFFNRYTGRIEEEKVPNSSFIHWLYEKKAGRCFLKTIVRHPWFSKVMGGYFNLALSRSKISRFIKDYNIHMDNFIEPENGYRSFNDFFARQLKSGKRLIDLKPNTVVFPADARHLGFQKIDDCQKFFIKGKAFNLHQLIQDEEIAQQFHEGTIVISRLCPADYHRFHFPHEGTISPSHLINGWLYSVSPLALRKSVENFHENKRWWSCLSHEQYGKTLLIEVGATCVGATRQTYQANTHVRKNQEKGYFLFGGSTVITVFQKDRVRLAEDLITKTQQGYELYAHCGDFMGEFF